MPLRRKHGTSDDAAAAAVCDRRMIMGKRPRVVLSITPRLLHDTLTLALSQHAEVVDVDEWRDGSAPSPAEPEVFDVALVSGGLLPEALAADVVIDLDGHDGVPNLDALRERLRRISVAE